MIELKTRSNGFSDMNREDWIYFLGSYG